MPESAEKLLITHKSLQMEINIYIMLGFFSHVKLLGQEVMC